MRERVESANGEDAEPVGDVLGAVRQEKRHRREERVGRIEVGVVAAVFHFPAFSVGRDAPDPELAVVATSTPDASHDESDVDERRRRTLDADEEPIVGVDVPVIFEGPARRADVPEVVFHG